MSKRPGGSLGSLLAKKSKEDERAASASAAADRRPKSGLLNNPIVLQEAVQNSLFQVHHAARQFLPKETASAPVEKSFCEVEARLGILKAPGCAARATSSGLKNMGNNQTAVAFQCKNCTMQSGVSRSHYVHWTQAGLSAVSPISQAFGVKDPSKIKELLHEVESEETVYGGYGGGAQRVCYLSNSKVGKMEHKEKLATLDLALPAAPYDLRLTLSSEKILNYNKIQGDPPKGWTVKRFKRRRSYTQHEDGTWQLDVTEVTTSYPDATRPSEVSYEIELELSAEMTLEIINASDKDKLQKLCKTLAEELHGMLKHMNPSADVMDVEEYLREHPDKQAVQLALAQCSALKWFMDGGAKNFVSAIGSADTKAPKLKKFIGCMPVNFSRRDIDKIQRSPENGYFLSEKADGVRYFMIFTGKTAVLVDRDLKGKQPIPAPQGNPNEDPMAPVLPLIKPGTVLDGEVVMHRNLRRPIFIVFDVLALGTDQPVLDLPFEQRLDYLTSASFRTATADREKLDVFDKAAVMNKKGIALPLVRKNFVKRLKLDDLLEHVVEEQGARTYRDPKDKVYNHLTDGIIFQPNLPYVCGTDFNLLKWKYLDTVTIDVEISRVYSRNDEDEDILRLGVLGEEGTIVDMTRHIELPKSELLRLEADRKETGSKIAEVGFDPATGEWYYLTMRRDKTGTGPNHISTVVGILLELKENVTTEELSYRMNVPVGVRDTYMKDVRRMQRQLLEFQRKDNKARASAAGNASR